MPRLVRRLVTAIRSVLAPDRRRDLDFLPAEIDDELTRDLANPMFQDFCALTGLSPWRHPINAEQPSTAGARDIAERHHQCWALFNRLKPQLVYHSRGIVSLRYQAGFGVRFQHVPIGRFLEEADELRFRCERLEHRLAVVSVVLGLLVWLLVSGAIWAVVGWLDWEELGAFVATVASFVLFVLMCLLAEVPRHAPTARIDDEELRELARTLRTLSSSEGGGGSASERPPVVAFDPDGPVEDLRRHLHLLRRRLREGAPGRRDSEAFGRRRAE